MRHPQVRQREQCHQLRRVLPQAAEARLHITELALDHPERVFELRAQLRLGLFDLAIGFVQGATLIQLLVSTTVCRDLSDYLSPTMLSTFLDAGITGIGADHVLRAVQQFVDLSNIRNVGGRAHHAVHQTRLVIHADLGLHVEVILFVLLGLMHVRVALTVFILGRTWRILPATSFPAWSKD